MFKINRKIEYALIALKHMSQKKDNELTSAKEICDIFQAPFDPTSRVLQIMTQHGILQAEQGAKGGYKIVKDLTQISLFELSEMIIGPIEIVNCMQNEKSTCEIMCHCQIIAPMLELNDKLNTLFKTINIADLLGKSHAGVKEILNKSRGQLVS